MTYNEINTDIIDYILELFRIEPKDKISSLSTGQKKALRFALTISRTTSVYIMDEPFANIDIDTRTKFKKLIFDYIDIDPFGTPNPFLDSAVKKAVPTTPRAPG